MGETILVLVDGGLGGLLALGRDTPHTGELVADAVLLVVELAVVDHEAEDDGRHSEDNSDDKEDVHVVVVGADDAGPLRGADGVGGDGSKGVGEDGCTLGGTEHGKIFLVVARKDVGLNCTDEGITTSTTHLGEEEEVSSDGSDILVTDADLCGNLKGDTEEASTHTLKNLGEHSLNIGGAGGSVLDHEANAKHSNAGTRDQDPLVVLGTERKEAGRDTKDGQSQRLTIGEVESAGAVIAHDDERPVIGRDPGSVEAEEVEEADGGGKVNVAVEPPSPVEDGLGSKDLPDAEADEHETADDEHGDDPASGPAVGLELCEVERKKEEEETNADEEESECVNVDEEGVHGGDERHGLVRVIGDQTLCLGPPLVDGEGEDNGEGGDGSADAKEAGAPSPVDGADLAGDLRSGVEVDDVGKTDETDGGTSPLCRDVVGDDDLLHDLDTSVAEGVDDGASSDVTSLLSYSDNDETKNPEEDRQGVGLSTTKDVGQLCDGELADGDEDSLYNRDGGVGFVVVEGGGGVRLPGIHGVVVEAVEVGDEGDAEDADPERPIGYTSTCLGSDDTDLLVVEVVFVVVGVLRCIPAFTLDVLDVGGLRHVGQAEEGSRWKERKEGTGEQGSML